MTSSLPSLSRPHRAAGRSGSRSWRDSPPPGHGAGPAGQRFAFDTPLERAHPPGPISDRRDPVHVGAARRKRLVAAEDRTAPLDVDRGDVRDLKYQVRHRGLGEHRPGLRTLKWYLKRPGALAVRQGDLGQTGNDPPPVDAGPGREHHVPLSRRHLELDGELGGAQRAVAAHRSLGAVAVPEAEGEVGVPGRGRIQQDDSVGSHPAPPVAGGHDSRCREVFRVRVTAVDHEEIVARPGHLVEHRSRLHNVPRIARQRSRHTIQIASRTM